ncbi:uncharacterized protein LOC114157996 isoform X1 [Scomber scombrus]|uniref:Uncharacterized protein LOC114157996 isoform X1 n=1 Tax=Scomber scombrus TaxID=13677 RepID=A0AAV1P4A9_SCOSC
MKKHLATYNDKFKEEVRREFAGFKDETNRKLAQNVAEIQAQRKDITEAQERVAELEEWNIEAKEAILTLLKQQTKLQEKLTEVEGHGRRCNLRIYNLAERDNESVTELMEGLLRRELALPVINQGPGASRTPVKKRRTERAQNCKNLEDEETMKMEKEREREGKSS